MNFLISAKVMAWGGIEPTSSCLPAGCFTKCATDSMSLHRSVIRPICHYTGLSLGKGSACVVCICFLCNRKFMLFVVSSIVCPDCYLVQSVPVLISVECIILLGTTCGHTTFWTTPRTLRNLRTIHPTIITGTAWIAISVIRRKSIHNLLRWVVY